MNNGCLYQTGSVADYCEQFISYAAPLVHLSEDVMLSNFIKGMEPRIRTELRVLNPNFVDEA